MQRIGTRLILSAHDLVGHLNCRHLTDLDVQVTEGALAKPARWDPLLEILQERGLKHEADFLDHLKDRGLSAVAIRGIEVDDETVGATLEAMRSGQQIIVQAALRDGSWIGRADVLTRVEEPSHLGSWSYEIIDTKLARETKAGTVLQLSLYADLLRVMQGVAPENVYVVVPWSNFVPQTFRVADYGAFFRKARRAAEEATNAGSGENYPEPTEHCDICRWAAACEARWRKDDHLSLVASISKSQIAELRAHSVSTAKAFAQLPSPFPWKPDRGSPASFEKARAQAHIQVSARETGELKYEMLEVVTGAGLCRLPEPSLGDIFFDIEGDPFIGEHGLEYLFGYHYRNEAGDYVRVADWAFDRNNEKAIFERFMDFVIARRAQFPDLHIYHYAPYEPGTLKRLMGRYATRESEVDKLLRGNVLVDLYTVVRNSVRASVESYSIKKLEAFYGFVRGTPLREANVALTALQVALQVSDVASVSEEVKAIVAAYNDDDCRSAEALRDWLEQLRTDAIASGAVINRPSPEKEEPSEDVSEREARIAALIERLTYNVPVDEAERNPAEHGKWILAYCLDWHRREAKSNWWEYFRLGDLTAEELLDEKAGLGGLRFIGTVDQTKTGIPTDRYEFDPQDTDIRDDDDLRAAGGDAFGKVVAISQDGRTVDIKKTKKTAAVHPDGVFAHTHIGTPEQENSLFRLGQHVADHGIEGNGEYQAARDLLMRHPPRVGGALHIDGEDTLTCATRIAPLLQGGVLPIQGPPGTGKSFTAAHMICTLINEGKRVGITANSHKVIRNLIDKTIEVASESDTKVRAGQKISSKTENTDDIHFYTDNGDAVTAITSGEVQVMGGTAFFWAREDAAGSVDVLFVDEAAQMSLANVLSVSQAGPALVLLGDPQQLEQPTQGSHPDGTGVSALDHLLGGHQTIVPEQGLFLEETWRLHPDITAFNSELFYEGKLESEDDCHRQSTTSTGPFTGTGLRYVPVAHFGNQSRSLEEAAAVERIVETLLGSGMHWTDRKGVSRPLALEDIIVIAPYNAHVFEIQKRLPEAHVGTVDKFQGQEAPIAIYSMATSTHADAPRGMEFLYSANRLNVAISRAKCMALLVASPDLFEAECKTPRQMQLANAFCRYLEMAETVDLASE
ncbi:TM0106 family RecB-like putative nuclease [Sinorhizobium meliloti]|uniref:TM0106 family RecB-like putative nuclease n=1 Tax=Rhizobium meliloti TaxID=382 RepID=UPI000FD81D82|nr:TM0106 family RecB-like putative nuclease [Sinorhizobium meliloti]MDW9377918.1 TM0106 family RecB-like putative nuclease [Sinorhizobium meliloti]MDW9496360.1 TM0106 family RecB-like putative nuclease [Sinorhizobium meliloti]MDW9564840.1 TM0106 family RecB-like putative nuclease [Sinorhizobium meliloti]MDW9652301.1 TM0106 family RecB-like putative nuclease [Sinorhizobium meliloti]MDW9862674.1 TM0106 family RecB-like putative nuclease [Sinorhizobium meliloti]